MTEEKIAGSGPSEDVDFVEMHDARITPLVFLPGGRGVLNFSHIAVYKKVKPSHYDVWSYKAELRLEGITKVVLNDQLAEDDYIGIDLCSDVEGKEISCLSLGRKTQVAKIDIWMGSGAHLYIELQAAEIILLEAVEKFEEFIESSSEN